MHGKNVFLMENHNNALSCWRKTCQKNRILVHADSHFDFAWIADKNPQEILDVKSLADFKLAAKENLFWNLTRKSSEELTHIGNYIYPAIKENIVREFYWVLPDSLFSQRRRIIHFKKDIENIIKFSPEEKTRLVWQDDCLVSNICNIKLIICRLKDLPGFEEDVLLDIDVDYFIDKEKLWLYADTFVQRLKEKGLKSDLITIAYSVEGGFTPIGYKFIGDHLAYLLNGHATQNGRFDRVVSLLIKAIKAKDSRLYKEAILYLKEADSCHPGYAAVYYHLSDLYYNTGLNREALEYYQKAVSADSSYRTSYNNAGPMLENRLKLRDAEAEYRKMIELDPDNPDFLIRLGNIYRKRKRWDEALLNYNEALKLNPNSEEALRNIGCIHTVGNDLNDGIEYLKRAISLKPDNPFAHSYLGLIYLKKKDYNEAMRETRRAINSGLFTSPSLRWRLVFIYLKKGLYARMLDELKAAFIVSYFDVFWRLKGWLRY